MHKADAVLDLDYDSPLESLFAFLGSPASMVVTTLGAWFIMVSPGKNGAPPIWADFPIVPFALGMACIWAVGFWLKANYDVRYQLDSSTQQLNLVRKIFGQTFKTRVAEFAQLHSAAVMSTWSDSKSGRSWSYALCLVTKSARLVRVSSWGSFPQETEAAKVAANLGIANFKCKIESGKLVARRNRDGEVDLNYKAPIKDTNVSGWVALLAIFGFLGLIFWFCWAMMQ